MTEWTIAQGAETTRSQVAEAYGCGSMGGIQTSRTTPNILLYSDPTVGHAHGYRFDGWGPDGAYYYTGEGQVGDQTITKGNKAIADSTTAGKVLRLFEAASGKRAGGKLQRYLGAFHVNPPKPLPLRNRGSRRTRGHPPGPRVPAVARRPRTAGSASPSDACTPAKP